MAAFPPIKLQRNKHHGNFEFPCLVFRRFQFVPEAIKLVLHSFQPEFFWASAALWQAAELRRLQKPTRRQIDFLTTWLKRPGQGNLFLNDVEQDIWDKPNVPDLVSPSQRPQDSFTEFVSGRFLEVDHWLTGQKAQACGCCDDSSLMIQRS